MADQSPAGTLRTAARLMRERAQAATPGPWKHMCLGSDGCLVVRDSRTLRERGGHGRVARFGCKDWQADHADAEYVTRMGPDLAGALADLLEAEAKSADLRADGGMVPRAPIAAALTVARAFLAGETQ